MAINYVKFIRGTPTAFAKLTQKNSDTLYFISDVNSNTGALYLGEKLISGAVSSFEDLSNILINENLKNKDLLSYDINTQSWVNSSVVDAIGIMTGATKDSQGKAGLVPAPGIGQNDLFLRGDGTWVALNNTGIDNEVIVELNKNIEKNTNEISNIYKSIDDVTSVLNQKVDVSNVYTKEEIDNKIFESNNHLVRKIFTSIEEAYSFIATVTNPADYIYLISTNLENSNNKYTEYFYIDGSLEFVGSLDINLKGYATLEELQSIQNQIGVIETNVVDLVSLLNNSNEEIENVKISLEDIDTSITTLSNDLGEINSKIINLETDLNKLNTGFNSIVNEVTDIKTVLDKKVDQSDYDTTIEEINNDLTFIKESITWNNLSEN